MVVAEFTSAEDTQPTVVAGTAPTAEHTTTTTTTSITTSDVPEAAATNGNTNGMPGKWYNPSFSLIVYALNDDGSTDISIVQRVGAIPIVADGIGTFEYAVYHTYSTQDPISSASSSCLSRRSVVNSTQITSSMYATAGAIAASMLPLHPACHLPDSDCILFPQSLSMLPRPSSPLPLL